MSLRSVGVALESDDCTQFIRQDDLGCHSEISTAGLTSIFVCFNSNLSNMNVGTTPIFRHVINS